MKLLGQHKHMTARLHWKMKEELVGSGIYLIIPVGKKIHWHFEKLEIGNYVIVPSKYSHKLSLAHAQYSTNHPGIKFAVKTINGISYCKRIS